MPYLNEDGSITSQRGSAAHKKTLEAMGYDTSSYYVTDAEKKGR